MLFLFLDSWGRINYGFALRQNCRGKTSKIQNPNNRTQMVRSTPLYTYTDTLPYLADWDVPVNKHTRRFNLFTDPRTPTLHAGGEQKGRKQVSPIFLRV